MQDQTITASAHEVMAVEPVIRRVVAARAANHADVDDLVQDCLERLLVARGRLAPEAVLPYAVVTARNLVSSHAKTASRRAAAAPRVLDVTEPERPDDVLLAGEARTAMTAALARLSDQERRDILAYYSDDSAGGAQARESRGALRVRMARTRAKLRLEYLLAFRHVELPSPACRSVLLAISAGDTRRQRELAAGQHLLDCAACATLSEPLYRRGRGPGPAARQPRSGRRPRARTGVKDAGGGHQPAVRSRARGERCRGAAVASPADRQDRDGHGRHGRSRGDAERVLGRVFPGADMGTAGGTAATASDSARRPGPFHRDPDRQSAFVSGAGRSARQ
jgi:RNA polymerase sigma factor (sigma-70 family)